MNVSHTHTGLRSPSRRGSTIRTRTRTVTWRQGLAASAPAPSRASAWTTLCATAVSRLALGPTSTLFAARYVIVSGAGAYFPLGWMGPPGPRPKPLSLSPTIAIAERVGQERDLDRVDRGTRHDWQEDQPGRQDRQLCARRRRLCQHQDCACQRRPGRVQGAVWNEAASFFCVIWKGTCAKGGGKRGGVQNMRPMIRATARRNDDIYLPGF